jgi:hypothetical protein
MLRSSFLAFRRKQSMRFLGRALVSGWVRPSGVIALLALVVGCAGRGDVSGRVTYKGKALVFGTVQMAAADKTFKWAAPRFLVHSKWEYTTSRIGY